MKHSKISLIALVLASTIWAVAPNRLIQSEPRHLDGSSVVNLFPEEKKIEKPKPARKPLSKTQKKVLAGIALSFVAFGGYRYYQYKRLYGNN